MIGRTEIRTTGTGFPKRYDDMYKLRPTGGVR